MDIDRVLTDRADRYWAGFEKFDNWYGQNKAYLKSRYLELYGDIVTIKDHINFEQWAELQYEKR